MITDCEPSTRGPFLQILKAESLPKRVRSGYQETEFDMAKKP
jgi:hypothetical protein